jgi:ribosomal protein S18 acetylase RimI-like enzyme
VTVRLRLDLRTFNAAPYEPYRQRCLADGITFTTMADVGDTDAHRRQLYDLNRICAADIPERGAFFTFEQYVAVRLAPDLYEPAGVILAIDGAAWVGFSYVSVQPDDVAHVMMTGVLPSHRGRGLSVALKLPAIAYARSRGARWMYAEHHPANTAAIAMNRRLGFVDA